MRVLRTQIDRKKDKGPEANSIKLIVLEKNNERVLKHKVLN